MHVGTTLLVRPATTPGRRRTPTSTSLNRMCIHFLNPDHINPRPITGNPNHHTFITHPEPVTTNAYNPYPSPRSYTLIPHT